MSNYRMDSLTKLIEKHLFENDRINKEDKERTQNLIEQEIMERAKRIIKVLKDTENIEIDLKRKTIEEEAAGIVRWIMNP